MECWTVVTRIIPNQYQLQPILSQLYHKHQQTIDEQQNTKLTQDP